jgi:hypothetical protein
MNIIIVLFLMDAAVEFTVGWPAAVLRPATDLALHRCLLYELHFESVFV